MPTDQEYKKFSFLLTLKRLQDHPEYAQWNPYVNRVRCSKEIVPLVQPFVQNEKSNLRIAENDRLIQLLVKGLLYESSVEHCQARATNTTETLNLSSPTTLLNNTRLSDTDASLLSWLHALPPESFSSPFEQKSLVVQVEKVRKSEEKPRATPLERSLPTVEEEIVDEMAKGRAAILKHFDEEEEDAPFHSFVPLVRVEDAQVIRAVDVHPSGAYFAVGSNSKILRVCVYPTSVQPGKVLFQKGKHHQGSIYCLTWSPSGCLLSSGSNDKTIKILRLDVDRPDDPLNNSEVQLSHHDGTIRDLLFLDETQLLSGGAGERNLVLSDVRKQVALQTFEGHRGKPSCHCSSVRPMLFFLGHVYALHSWERNCFVSAGDDGTCRLWDARQVAPVHSLPARSSASPVASVAVNFSGEILAAGYEDAFCLLYDLRTRRNLQIYQPHADQVRSVRFAGRTNVLLSASYDKQVILTNLDGRSDLTKPLVHSKVATHSDKIIQARWFVVVSRCRLLEPFRLGIRRNSPSSRAAPIVRALFGLRARPLVDLFLFRII